MGLSKSKLSGLILSATITMVCLCLQAARSGWLVSVASSPALPAKLVSSAISLTPNGNILLVINPYSNSVTLIDTAQLSPIAEIPVGIEPRSLAVSPVSERAFISNFASDTVSVLNLAATSVIQTLQVGDRPAGVAASPDGRFIAVAEMGEDRLRILDAATLETLSIQVVADRPYGLAFTPDSQRLLVSHLLSGQVTVLDVKPYTHYFPIVVQANDASPPSRRELEKPSTREVLRPQQTASIPSSHSGIPTWSNIAPAPSVLVNASGTRAYLPQTMANGLGLNTQFDTTVFPKVSVINLQTDTHQTAEHISLPETDRPVGLPWDVALAKDDSEL